MSVKFNNYDWLKPQRVWVNQPSGLQDDHDLHGQVGIAVLDSQDTPESPFARLYFASGPVESTRIAKMALSPGSPPEKPRRVIKVIESGVWKIGDVTLGCAINRCEITCDGVVSKISMTDAELNMEQLQDKLIASGADPDLVEKFRVAVSHYDYDERTR
jgi:hypothetical protein